MSATAEQITAACEHFGLVEADLEIGTAVVKHIPGSAEVDVYAINVSEMISGLESAYSSFGDGITIFAFSDLADAEVTINDPEGLLQDGLGN